MDKLINWDQGLSFMVQTQLKILDQNFKQDILSTQESTC